MKTAAASKLKAYLREYLDEVKAGNEVLITDRGKPVARLVPISRTREGRESLARMEKQGLIRLGSGKLSKDFGAYPGHRTRKGSFEKPLWMRETATLIWAQENPQGLEIVCLDQYLREARHKRLHRTS